MSKESGSNLVTDQLYLWKACKKSPILQMSKLKENIILSHKTSFDEPTLELIYMSGSGYGRQDNADQYFGNIIDHCNKQRQMLI